MISDKLVEFARQGGQYRFGHPLNRIPRSAWPQQGELERARGRNMTDAERREQTQWQMGLARPVDWDHPDAGRILPSLPPAPDYTEDGLMAIEGERE